jgi:hypothetical protein
MATPYSVVYNSFLDKVSDTDLLALTTTNTELIILGYMNRTCTKFERICVFNLSDRDDTTRQFSDDLTDEDIDIISEGMLVEWYKPKLHFNENLKNVLNTKDYNQYSPANLLKEIRESYKSAKNNFESMVNKYSYVHGAIEDLKPENYNT